MKLYSDLLLFSFFAFKFNVLRRDTEAEQIVVRMIEAGEIFASVSQRDGMVSFHGGGAAHELNPNSSHSLKAPGFNP